MVSTLFESTGLLQIKHFKKPHYCREVKYTVNTKPLETLGLYKLQTEIHFPNQGVVGACLGTDGPELLFQPRCSHPVHLIRDFRLLRLLFPERRQ